MSQISANMGLKVWNLTTDLYNHTELAANFNKIDQHDHSHGSGVIIDTAGISPAAINTARLADNSVTRAKIADNAVGSAELDNAYIHPIGSVLMWWRPNNTVSLPSGWVVPRGQTLTSGQHDFAVVGSITLPDLRNCFILGADTTNTGTTPDDNPSIGAGGGRHTRDFNHTHNVLGHIHTISAHAHTVNSHDHNVLPHDHGDGSLGTDRAAPRDVRINSDNGGTWKVDAVLAANGSDNGHNHNVNGRTANNAASTSNASPGTTSTALTTNSSTSSTNAALGESRDMRPAFVGLLYIMKVKLV